MPKGVSKVVRRRLKNLTTPHEIEKSKDHYWLKVGGRRRCIVGGNSKERPDLIKHALRAIDQLEQEMTNGQRT